MGPDATGNANNNSVTMTDGAAASVYGGKADYSNAMNNTVTISGGIIRDDVFGGNAGYTASADNNTVIISGGTVRGSVTGGISDSQRNTGTARNNKVIFSGGTIGGDLWGGLGATSSNNTLEVYGKGRSVGREVNYFQNFVFNLPADVAAGDKILEVGTQPRGGLAVIDGATVDVKGTFPKLKSDEFITLIDKTDGGTVTFANGKDTISKNYGFLESDDFSLEVGSAADKPLLLNYNGLRNKVNPYATNGDGLNDYVKAAQDRGEVGEAFVNDMSRPAGARFLSRAISTSYGNASIAAAKAVESAMHLATVSAVPHMALWANQSAANAVTQRTSLALPDGSMLQSTAVDSGKGLNSGDDITGLSAGNSYDKTGFAMWIMPLWQSNNLFGMKAGDNLSTDIHANIGGVALGADYTWDQMFRLGLTFNIGGGYAEGSGDFSKSTNSMNFWGIGAYAGLAYNNFGLTADVSYTSTFNSIKQELDPSFAMQDPKSDVRAYALSAGLRGEYTFGLDNLNITPHVGVRYTALYTDSYDVKSGGETIVEADKTSQGIWTFPIGVQFAKSFDMNNGWYVKPSLDLAITPAAGDIENKRDVRFTGVSGGLTAEAQIMDWITYGGQAGLEFGNGNMKLGVNYNLQLGAHSTNHGVFGTFRYEF